MNDLMNVLQVAPAGVVAIGLVLAVLFQRRLRRVAGLAICAFAALSMVYLGSMIWARHVRNVLADEAARSEAGEILILSDRLRWGFVAVSVVGFTLLLAAVVTGPGRTSSDSAGPPPDSGEAGSR
jgi:hypothetical protein